MEVKTGQEQIKIYMKAALEEIMIAGEKELNTLQKMEEQLNTEMKDSQEEVKLDMTTAL